MMMKKKIILVPTVFLTFVLFLSIALSQTNQDTKENFTLLGTLFAVGSIWFIASIFYVWLIHDFFEKPKLKCPNCNKNDAVRLYSYSWTYEVKVSIGRYNPETKIESLGRGRYLETDLRGWVDKCCFCDYDFVCNHISYSSSVYSQSDYEFSQLTADGQALQIWADSHNIVGGVEQVRKKYLFNNKINAIQVCRKCERPNLWGNKCSNCGDSNSEELYRKGNVF